MAEPIVFISRLRLRQGAVEAFVPMFQGAVRSIAAAKPRTAVFAAYLGDDRSAVSIVHVFPDAAAMAQHFEGSDDRAGSIADLVEYIGFEVYGNAPRAAIDQLAVEARDAGATLTTYPDPIGGYLTAPA
jgi:hypothetical protein